MLADGEVCIFRTMPRKREPLVPLEEETCDRKAVLRWLGSRTLEEAGRELGRTKQWLSRWFRHEAELHDLDVDQWVRATGVSRRKLLDGRIESRLLVERLQAAA